MKEITNIHEFTNWLFENDCDDYLEQLCFDKNHYSLGGDSMLEIPGLRVDEEDVKDKHFVSTRFTNCTFKSVNFSGVIFDNCEFDNCIFLACDFTWVKFYNPALKSCKFNYCTIAGMELNDSESYNTTFENCNELSDLIVRGYGDRDLNFSSCYLYGLRLEPMQTKYRDRLVFEDCVIKESNFDRIDFSDSCIAHSSLSLNQFSSCTFTDNTFLGDNSTAGNEFNMIDIRTILNSTPIANHNLETLFGIHNSEIKDYLHDLTTEIKFQSVFISYSFEDKEFANTINDFLRRKGVFTFLWEKNSIGGESLDYIMESGIKEKDRVLFIASENSIKSKACQFELTQGQKKQEITWENTLFPIHVDKFLFSLKKEQIRPVNKQEEYWSNILELRKLNSLDFIEFYKKEDRDNHKFNKMLFRLLKGLQK